MVTSAWEPLASPPFWYVIVPGEEAPHIHHSLDSASAQADLIARVHIETKVHIYQLKTVGSVVYPDQPSYQGDFIKNR